MCRKARNQYYPANRGLVLFLTTNMPGKIRKHSEIDAVHGENFCDAERTSDLIIAHTFIYGGMHGVEEKKGS